jgi:hypothetical protein
MKIHSICLVKDEADIVRDVVLDARKWSDYIYIYDNGSTDGTTEILKELGDTYSDVIFYKWSDRQFDNSLRGVLYHAFSSNSEKGDWWCRLDADEFYIDDPRQFLRQIDDGSNAVSHSSFNFYFTDKDLKKYKKDPDSFSYKDLRYYKNNWSEIRFIHDNGHLYWPSNGSWPTMNMNIYNKKIRAKHYQYRNPDQIQKRVKNRKSGLKNFDPHRKKKFNFIEDSSIFNLEERLVSHKALDRYEGNGQWVANDNLPMWKPDDSPVAEIKTFIKNVLFRLNLLKYI